VSSALLDGEVIATFGRQCRVQQIESATANLVSISDTVVRCVTRGRRADIACGDRVKWRSTSEGEGVIEQVLERRNLLFRSDQYRQKLIASNVDRVLIVVAVEPTFADDLLSRALVAADAVDLPVGILLNKVELPDVDRARERLSVYEGLGAHMMECSLREAPKAALEQLLPWLQGATTVVIGQSGMGKSTLVNLLIPHAQIATREISERLDSGKHTTTSAQIYAGNGFRLVDSPGFQEFGLAHLSARMLENAFIEFRPYLGGCRFYNCRHLDEPACAIATAVASGGVASHRHDLYRQLLSELRDDRLVT
jgi:ribosome biogenesis GTPase